MASFAGVINSSCVWASREGTLLELSPDFVSSLVGAGRDASLHQACGPRARPRSASECSMHAFYGLGIACSFPPPSLQPRRCRARQGNRPSFLLSRCFMEFTDCVSIAAHISIDPSTTIITVPGRHHNLHGLRQFAPELRKTKAPCRCLSQGLRQGLRRGLRRGRRLRLRVHQHCLGLGSNTSTSPCALYHQPTILHAGSISNGKHNTGQAENPRNKQVSGDSNTSRREELTRQHTQREYYSREQQSSPPRST